MEENGGKWRKGMTERSNRFNLGKRTIILNARKAKCKMLN